MKSVHGRMLVVMLAVSGVAFAGARSRTTARLLALFRPDERGRTQRYDAVYHLGPRLIRSRLKLGFAKRSKFVTTEETFTGRRLGCRQRGVLKLALSNTTFDPSRGRVLIDLIVRQPKGYVFNIGDSRSNEGLGGDAGTQMNDAEVTGYGRDFKVFLNEEEENRMMVMRRQMYRKRLTVLIGDGELIWLSDDNRGFNYIFNSGLFALRDQFDGAGPENFDIYVGVNRGIKRGTFNVGSGTCSVGIRFVSAFD